MENRFIGLLADKIITYKEFVICMFIREKRYTVNELADILKTDRKNMYHSMVNLCNKGVLNMNNYTKEYNIK